jgi:hypothetical protein
MDKKLKDYNEREERFRLAVEEATTNKAASINSIATKYKVSRTTLSRRIHGFKNTRTSHEKQQKFTNEEELMIVARIQAMLSDNHQPQKREILSICEDVLKNKFKDAPMSPESRENCFKVGKNWIDRFLERHNSELMINGEVSLAEYYKNEYLERKRLRTERGYKSIDSDTLTPVEEKTTIQQQVNHHDPFGYPEQQQYPPHSHMDWPLQKNYDEKYPYFPQHHNGSTLQPTSSAQSHQNGAASNSLSQFSFPPHHHTTSTAAGSSTSMMNEDDPIESLFIDGKFHYDLTRQRLLKELESEDIDRLLMVRMINTAFVQLERDLAQARQPQPPLRQHSQPHPHGHQSPALVPHPHHHLSQQQQHVLPPQVPPSQPVHATEQAQQVQHPASRPQSQSQLSAHVQPHGLPQQHVAPPGYGLHQQHYMIGQPMMQSISQPIMQHMSQPQIGMMNGGYMY